MFSISFSNGNNCSLINQLLTQRKLEMKSKFISLISIKKFDMFLTFYIIMYPTLLNILFVVTDFANAIERFWNTKDLFEQTYFIMQHVVLIIFQRIDVLLVELFPIQKDWIILLFLLSYK